MTATMIMPPSVSSYTRWAHSVARSYCKANKLSARLTFGGPAKTVYRCYSAAQNPRDTRSPWLEWNARGLAETVTVGMSETV